MFKLTPSWMAIIAVLVLGMICAVIYNSNPIKSEEKSSSENISDERVSQHQVSDRNLSPDSGRKHTSKSHTTEKDKTALWQRLIDLSAEDAIALLLSLSSKDINAAYELALALGGLDERSEAAREALRGLIERDLEAAIAWGEKQDPSSEMNLFWAAAIDLTAGSDPARAFELAGKTSGELRLVLLDNIFSEWVGEDLEAAKSTAMKLGSLEERSAACIAILSSELDRDLEETLAWIESITDSDIQDTLYYHAARDWAVSDPSGAANFVESLVESDYKTHVAGLVLDSWIKEDPNSALVWASKLPDQESRGEAISRGIRNTFEYAPEKAANLSLNLSSESDRAPAIEYVISAWVESDPDALAKWISQVQDVTTRTRMTQMMQDHLSP